MATSQLLSAYLCIVSYSSKIDWTKLTYSVLLFIWSSVKPAKVQTPCLICCGLVDFLYNKTTIQTSAVWAQGSDVNKDSRLRPGPRNRLQGQDQDWGQPQSKTN